MTFTKSQNYDRTYYVSAAGKMLGKVRRVEAWVVRGTRIEWEATKAGKYLGTFKTRNDAAEFLASR